MRFDCLQVGVCLCIYVASIVFGKRLSMKVVKEPTNYGLNLMNHGRSADEQSLKLRVSPSKFSGPPHLRHLLGKCYAKVSNDYKYEFCPFHNITQHEQTLRWNPFRGVLGVWQQWTIENNTFTSMLMQDGDSCGSLFRSTKVIFECGNKTAVRNISEPETCSYLLEFVTPLVCHPDSMLVYPVLSEEFQDEWDRIEGSLLYGDITQKGYKKQLNSLFKKAGFVLTKEQKQIQKQIKEDEEKNRKLENGIFDSLTECQTQYRKVYDELTQLKAVNGSNVGDQRNSTSGNL